MRDARKFPTAARPRPSMTLDHDLKGRNAMNRMHDRGRAALFCSAAMFALAFASPAVAQDQAQQPTPQQTAAQKGTPNGSEQIVITAQKRPQVLLDVPSSVTVI